MRLTKNRTLTLSIKDDPIVSIAAGRLTPKEWQKAFRKEGWSPSDLPRKEDLRYEWWRPSKSKTGYWKKSAVSDLKAVLVTVHDW